MNLHVNAIAGRLSLRPPQRQSLEILDRVTEIVPPKKGADISTALAAIKSEFPTVTDFEREFPSLCFALATGVGKTRLMGAFISYLHAAHGINHFFVLAPNLTIYNKLITDFTPNTPKYVFTGIAEFATEPPTVITGDNYESGVAARLTSLPGFGQEVHINIFNISKINSEVRGGKAPRIKHLSEYIGQSRFQEILDEANKPDSMIRLTKVALDPVTDLQKTNISYDEHSELLYDLAGQLIKHLRSYLSEKDMRNVLIYHQKPLAAFVHAPMQEHRWEKAGGYDVVVSKGFTDLKPSAYTAKDGEPIQDFRQTVRNPSRIGQMLFGGFQRGLYSVQKFDSDTERRLAIILDRDSQQWFRPASGQFQISYKLGIAQHDYQPDFVAEATDCIYMLEPKAKNEMTVPEVLAKKDAAVLWCNRATAHSLTNGGKPWKYVLIPHDVIAENMTLAGLVKQFAVG